MFSSRVTSLAVKILIVGSGAVLAFLSSIYLTNTLSKTDFANYSIIMTCVTVIAASSSLGLGGYSVKAFPQIHLINTTAYRIATYLFTIIFGLLFTGIWHYFYDFDFNSVSLFAISFSLIFQLRYIWQAEGKINASIFISSFHIPISIFCFFLYSKVYEKSSGPEYLILQISSIIALIFITIDTISIEKRFNFKEVIRVASLARQSIFWLLNSLTQIVFKNIDVLFLAHSSIAPKTIAVYVAVSKLNLISVFLLDFILNVYSHKKSLYISQERWEELYILFKSNQIYLVLYSVFILFTFLFFGEEILNLFGKGYAEGHDLLIIITLGAVLNNVCGPSGQILNLSGFHKITLLIIISSLCIMLVLAYFLSKYYAIYGVAWAMIAGVSFKNVATYIYMRIKVF